MPFFQPDAINTTKAPSERHLLLILTLHIEAIFLYFFLTYILASLIYRNSGRLQPPRPHTTSQLDVHAFELLSYIESATGVTLR